jgi:hypothetical protein
MADIDTKLNQHLWDYVHKLEFILLQNEKLKKRDQKLYLKKINLAAQYLDSIGVEHSTVKRCKYL